MSVEKQDFLWETQQVTQISKQTLGWKQEGCHDVHLIPDNRNTVLTKEALECLCAKEREREREEKQREKETKTETQRENARLRNPTGRTVRDHSHLCSVKARQRSHTSVTSSLYYTQDRRETNLMYRGTEFLCDCTNVLNLCCRRLIFLLWDVESWTFIKCLYFSV